jgi:steroid delta-isomerase
MTHNELFRAYLRHYADKNLEAISAMLAEEVHLRDWNISVFGKEEALRETAKNFAEAESIEINILSVHENSDTVAGELYIVVNRKIDLYVVEVVTFNTQDKATAIRSYKGRGD